MTVNKNIPEILYYKLDVLIEKNVPDVPKAKGNIIVDDEIVSGSEIRIEESLYNGKHVITLGTTTSFTYTLPEVPEKPSYGSSADISYETDCTHTYGPISEIQVTNPGANYYSLPGITTVTTASGNGAEFETFGVGIGSVKSVSIKDIGFKYPSDRTLDPTVLFPQVIKIESLASFDSIGIVSFSRGFMVAPKLVAIDGVTGKVVPDVDFKVTPGVSEVEILQNTKGMSNVTPTIIPTESGAVLVLVRYHTLLQLELQLQRYQLDSVQLILSHLQLEIKFL